MRAVAADPVAAHRAAEGEVQAQRDVEPNETLEAKRGPEAIPCDNSETLEATLELNEMSETKREPDVICEKSDVKSKL